MDIRDVKFTRGVHGVTLEGTTAPNAKVTVENLSAAPFAPTTEKDTFARGKADAQGHFSVTVPLAAEGDKLGVTVGAPAAGSSVLSVRLQGAGAVDWRRAEIGQQGLRLNAAGPGVFTFSNVRAQKKLGEPGANFELVNLRNQERTQFVLDARGQLPAGASVKGQPGDILNVFVGDGTNTAYMTKNWSALVIPNAPGTNGLVEPVLTSEATSGITTRRLDGPLFKDGPKPENAVQGQLGDCYLVSAAAALALNRPDALRKLFKENADGTVTVTFKQFDDATSRYVDHPVTITRDVPMHWGTPFYGTGGAAAETWFPMLEKAYAVWKGGYAGAECGYPYEMFEALMGTQGKHVDTRGVTADALWKTLKNGVDKHAPMEAWTGQESAERSFTNSGLYGDHAYTVMGVSEENGQKMVQLRNPWGASEPAGNGPDDGIFKLPLETFQKFYVGLGVAV